MLLPRSVPAVRDRVVQAAVRLVIEPIFEREFVSNSYGFRPKRGCKDALREVDGRLKSGYVWVVDADLRKYFDSIAHEPLMEEVRKRIADGRVLALIESFLKQGVLEEMTLWEPTEGVPQGAVISPLLANIYLHPIDVVMAANGYEMVRYADDFVILCTTKSEAEAALSKVKQLAAERGLSLHPEKTRLVNMEHPDEGFDFLGYHFRNGKRWPRKKSLKKLKEAIRGKTKRTNGHQMAKIIAEVNRTLRGWFEYFKHSRPWIFKRLDQWIRRRLRSILRRRMGLRGISRGRDHQRWPIQYFRDVGLFSLEEAHKRALLQSSSR